MNKWKSGIAYGCLTKLRPILIFYLVEYGFLFLIAAIIVLSVGSAEGSFNGREIASAVFLSVMGALSFREDFKAFLQNGFPRRTIFLSTFCSFLLVSAGMALLDVLLGELLERFLHYNSIFGMLYGSGSLPGHWLWLTLLYVTFCSIFYLAALVVNKVGRTAALLIGVGLAGVVLLIVALFRFAFSEALVSKIGRFVQYALGFMQNGTVRLVFPILTFLGIDALFALGSFALLRSTELK